MATNFEDLLAIAEDLNPQVSDAFNINWSRDMPGLWFNKVSRPERTLQESKTFTFSETVGLTQFVELHTQPDFVEPVFAQVTVNAKKVLPQGIRISSLAANDPMFGKEAVRQAGEIPQKVQFEYHKRMVRALQLGDTDAFYTSYDGAQVFSSSHEVGYTRAAFDNLFGLALTGANLNTVINTLRTVPLGPEGEPIWLGGKPMLVVPVELERTAREIINSTIIPQDNRSNQNPDQGIAEIQVEPLLTDANDWYVIMPNVQGVKPFVWLRATDATSDRLIPPTDPANRRVLVEQDYLQWSYKSFGEVFPIHFWQMAKSVV